MCDRIFDVEEKGVKMSFGTVGFPNNPMTILSVGVFFINAGSDLRLDNAEIRLKFKSVLNGQSCRGSFCGK